jgi:glycine betaine/proline transport system permease protein
MAFYDGLFKTLGLEGWCGDAASSAPMSMAELLAKSSGEETKGEFFPFPILGQSK